MEEGSHRRKRKPISHLDLTLGQYRIYHMAKRNYDFCVQREQSKRGNIGSFSSSSSLLTDRGTQRQFSENYQFGRRFEI